jgi:hypothetical protein
MQPVYGAAGILAIGLIIDGFLSGGRFTSTAMSRGDANGYVLIVDRFTGSATACVQQGCREIRTLPVLPPQSN